MFCGCVCSIFLIYFFKRIHKYDASSGLVHLNIKYLHVGFCANGQIARSAQVTGRSPESLVFICVDNSARGVLSYDFLSDSSEEEYEEDLVNEFVTKIHNMFFPVHHFLRSTQNRLKLKLYCKYKALVSSIIATHTYSIVPQPIGATNHQ